MFFHFERPLTMKAGEAWVKRFQESSAIKSAPSMSWQVLDMHRYITAKFATAAEADTFARQAKAIKSTIKYEVGGGAAEVNVIRRMNLPPHIERRGRALRTVYDILSTELRNGEELR